MKRKPAGSNQKRIIKYLNKVGTAPAAEIAREVGIGSNIYTILSKMCEDGEITRNGKYYEGPILNETPDDFIKPRESITVDIEDIYNATHIDIIKEEIEFVEEGIKVLETTKNYLLRRLDQLQNDAKDDFFKDFK